MFILVANEVCKQFSSFYLLVSVKIRNCVEHDVTTKFNVVLFNIYKDLLTNVLFIFQIFTFLTFLQI